MCKRGFLFPEEVEAELNKMRLEDRSIKSYCQF